MEKTSSNNPPSNSFTYYLNQNEQPSELSFLNSFNFEPEYKNILFTNILSAYEDENFMQKFTSLIDNCTTSLQNETSSQIFSINQYKYAENTLPGSIILIMKSAQGPVSIETITDNIKHKIHLFRKANGSKYKGEITNIIKSTLKSSGIFYKTTEGFYFYKERECNDFLQNSLKREIKKKQTRDKKDIKSTKTSSTSSKSKTKNKNEMTFASQISEKLLKITRIHDEMFHMYKNNMKYYDMDKKIVKGDIEELKNLCMEDKFVGVFMCVRYFKLIVEKYLKYVNKKKNIGNFFNLDRINQQILAVCDKVEQLEGMFGKETNQINIKETNNNSNECNNHNNFIVNLCENVGNVNYTSDNNYTVHYEHYENNVTNNNIINTESHKDLEDDNFFMIFDYNDI